MSESIPHDTGPYANPFEPNPDPFPDDQGEAVNCSGSVCYFADF